MASAWRVEARVDGMVAKQLKDWEETGKVVGVLLRGSRLTLTHPRFTQTINLTTGRVKFERPTTDRTLILRATVLTALDTVTSHLLNETHDLFNYKGREHKWRVEKLKKAWKAHAIAHKLIVQLNQKRKRK